MQNHFVIKILFINFSALWIKFISIQIQKTNSFLNFIGDESLFPIIILAYKMPIVVIVIVIGIIIWIENKKVLTLKSYPVE